MARKPQLDHFMGKTVAEVSEGDGSPVIWSIQFEGGGIVHNTDGRRSKIPAVVGMALSSTTLSDTETVLIFGPDSETGTERVDLTPDKYAISTPHSDGLYFPQMPDEDSAEATLPPDPSADRLNEEPPTPTPLSEEAPKKATRRSRRASKGTKA